MHTEDASKRTWVKHQNKFKRVDQIGFDSNLMWETLNQLSSMTLIPSWRNLRKLQIKTRILKTFQRSLYSIQIYIQKCTTTQDQMKWRNMASLIRKISLSHCCRPPDLCVIIRRLNCLCWSWPDLRQSAPDEPLERHGGAMTPRSFRLELEVGSGQLSLWWEKAVSIVYLYQPVQFYGDVVRIFGEICPVSDPDIAHMRLYLNHVKLKYTLLASCIASNLDFPMLNLEMSCVTSLLLSRIDNCQ